jgi:hypothetical protein
LVTILTSSILAFFKGLLWTDFCIQ